MTVPQSVRFPNKATVVRPKLGMPKKEKPWSHQDDLKALIGKNIAIEFISLRGQFDTYFLVAADAYAVKIVNPKDKSVLTYFKHQIAGYKEA
jgi:hypothetical protein